MNWLLNSSFAQDIGLTLVHSLWQILLVAAVFAIANWLLTQRSASLRYVVAYSALLLMFVLPFVTLLIVSTHPAISQGRAPEVVQRFEDSFPADAASEPAITYPPRAVVLFPTEPVIDPTQATPVATLGVVDERVRAVEPHATREWNWLLPWLFLAWSLGVITFSLRPFLALLRCRRMRTLARPIEVTWITDILESLCTRMELDRKVEIASSALVHIPTVMGFFRPIIMLPLSMVSGQTPHELSAIIAHELAHIRRHDYVLNLFQTAIETLLFYHPSRVVGVIVRAARTRKLL